MGGTPPWCKVKNIELTVGFADFWPFGSIFNRFGLTVNALVIVLCVFVLGPSSRHLSLHFGPQGLKTVPGASS